jgi:D-amino-acid dehydrogenase
MKKVLVAGGGIIGLTSAYYLAEAGLEVTIIDKYNFTNNCSTGNAGLIVPSHFIPLASPGIVWQGIKWILNPKSPFSMNFKPDLDLLKWSLSFWSLSNASHVMKSGPVLLKFNLLSRELYLELFKVLPQMKLKEKGLLMLCISEKKLRHEFHVADKAIEMGMDVRKLDFDGVAKMEPNIFIQVAGGVLYKEDAHLSPVGLTHGLIELLKKKKVSMHANTELLDLIIKNNKVKAVKTNLQNIEFDELVIATGVFSQPIFKKLNINAKVQAGKGYSFVHNNPSVINTPALLVDARVAVTPYEMFTRFAGAMEIGGVQGSIKQKKVEGMVESIRIFFPELNLQVPESTEVWTGLRPCSPDGLPYIGRVKNFKNVIIATGHSMMGISLAPATAKVVEELVSGSKLSFDIQPFSPER